jgi:hypothetical protein
MTPQDLRRLKDAFNLWAQSVPDPDAPAIGFVGEKMMSAREAAHALETETEAGKGLLEILEHGVNVEGIDKVVARLTRNVPKK